MYSESIKKNRNWIQYIPGKDEIKPKIFKGFIIVISKGDFF